MVPGKPKERKTETGREKQRQGERGEAYFGKAKRKVSCIGDSAETNTLLDSSDESRVLRCNASVEVNI